MEVWQNCYHSNRIPALPWQTLRHSMSPGEQNLGEICKRWAEVSLWDWLLVLWESYTVFRLGRLNSYIQIYKTGSMLIHTQASETWTIQNPFIMSVSNFKAPLVQMHGLLLSGFQLECTHKARLLVRAQIGAISNRPFACESLIFKSLPIIESLYTLMPESLGKTIKNAWVLSCRITCTPHSDTSHANMLTKTIISVLFNLACKCNEIGCMSDECAVWTQQSTYIFGLVIAKLPADLTGWNYRMCIQLQ